MAKEWRPDILGEPFEQLTLPLGEDDEGPVVATLVRSLAHHSLITDLLGDRRPLTTSTCCTCTAGRTTSSSAASPSTGPIAARTSTAHDLRKYGRSLSPEQTPGYITDLATDDEDIAAALAAMGRPLDGEPH